MSIFNTIKNRRATPPRLLTDKEISNEVVKQLLESANWAPNHKKTEPWRFQVYKGEAKAKLAETLTEILQESKKLGHPVATEKIEKFKTTLEQVPVAIAIVVQYDQGKRLPEWEEVAAVAMSVQNMWLHATEMGLGAFWATPFFIDLFNEALGISDNQKFLGFFYLGHTLMDYPSPGRGDMAEKVEWRLTR